MDLHRYVDPEHLPAGFKLDDPRTMKRAHIISFFEHILERQKTIEPANVFRFKTTKKSRKGSKTMDESGASDTDRSGSGDDDRSGGTRGNRRAQRLTRQRTSQNLGKKSKPSIGRLEDDATDNTGAEEIGQEQRNSRPKQKRTRKVSKVQKEHITGNEADDIIRHA